MVTGGQFYLDFINITVPHTAPTIKPITQASTSVSSATSLLAQKTDMESASSSILPPISASLSTGTSTSLSITSPISSAIPILPTVNGDESSGRKIPIENIVGGVLCGIFSITFITIGVIFLKRKRNNRRQRIDRFPLTRKQTMPLLVYSYLYYIEVSTSLGISTPYRSTKRDLANTRGVGENTYSIRPPANAF